MSAAEGKPAAVIFDMDDTLVATAALWRAAETKLLEALGHTWSSELAGHYKGMNALDVAATIHRALKPSLPLSTCQRIMRAELIGRFERGPLQAMPGAVELVHRLAGRYPLALASGSPPPAIEMALTTLGLNGTFAVCISSESVARGKPWPDVFLAAAEQLGVEPRQCLVFEDSLVGAQAAAAADMACIVCPSHGPQAIAATGARLVPSLTEVTDTLIVKAAASADSSHHGGTSPGAE